MEMRISPATMAVQYRRIEAYNPGDSMYHIVLVVPTSLLVTVMGAPDQRTHITIAVPGIKVLTLGSTNITLAVVLAKALFRIYVGETQDISRGPDKPRSALYSHHYDHHNMSKKDSHTNQNTQQYNGYSVHPQYNQRLNSVPSSSNQMYQKIK